ncbi:MAG: transporter substrate-binding domain-containing protein [Bacteroidota bacterium]
MKRLATIFLSILIVGLCACEKPDTTGKDLTILGEVMVPYCFEENGEYTGITVEVVQRIMSELELTQTLEIGTDWNAMLNRVTTEDNMVLFTTAITEDRKDLCKWVGPLAVWQYFTDSLDTFGTRHTLLGYLAFSKNVSDKIIANWQLVLDKMKDEGQLQTLFEKYDAGFDAPGQVAIFTESDPPSNFIDDNGNLDGSSVDMIEAMMGIMGTEDPIILSNWADGYDLVHYVPNTMLFSTFRTEERENLFKWVGPIGKVSYVFIVKADTDYHIEDLDDARSMRSIGTVAGWASEEQLIDLGFNNVVVWATPQEVLGKLLDESIPCCVLTDLNLRMLLQELGHPPKDVRKEATLSSHEAYMAFSPDTGKDLIAQWESAYDAIVANGTLQEIWDNWYPDIDW